MFDQLGDSHDLYQKEGQWGVSKALKSNYCECRIINLRRKTFFWVLVTHFVAHFIFLIFLVYV